MRYTTVAAAQLFGDFIDEEEDLLLNALILSASKIIDRYCRRVFAAADETIRTFRRSTRWDDPMDGPLLMVDEDLAEAASLIQNPDDLTWAPTVTYRLENNPPFWGIVLDEGTWPQVVNITGYWVFSKTPPPDIEFACLRLVKWLYDLKDTTKGSIPVVTPDGKVLLPEGLPSDIRSILNPYKRLQVA